MIAPLVSIVIPYFNGGEFVRETVVSAISQSYKNIEIIIVDDGSTEEDSIRIFDQLEHPILRKIRTKNQGLSMARNTGISLASGDFILPLDCDDLISNTYVQCAIEKFECNANLGIVYSHASFFGAVNKYWELPEYDKVNFLTSNCIFCSALFRRSDWKEVGGYKSDMIYGMEDYDFWLSLVGKGREVLRLPEVHFFYRKHGNSMISNLTQEKIHYSYNKIFERHEKLYLENLIGLVIKINQLNGKLKALESGAS